MSVIGGALAASALKRPALPEVSPLSENFAWGLAMAGFQSEGHSPDSNWTRYVAGIAATIDQPIGDSVDFLNRYQDDIERARDLGVSHFRYSVEWARTEPAPGEVDDEGFEFYDRLMESVRAAGMTPMISLDHWVYPGWVFDRGGWLCDEFVDLWMAHAKRVVSRYAGTGVVWITINEPSIYVDFEKRNRGLNRRQVAAMRARLLEAHRRAYQMIKRRDPQSWASSNISYMPAPLNVFDDRWFFDLAVDSMDFLGLDYYYSVSLDNMTAALDWIGRLWAIRAQPDGLLHALRLYHRKAPWLPIWIVENGISTDDGQPRKDGLTRSAHLLDHLYYLQRAVDEGIPVVGYNYWSLTDNYEWGSYRPRFGLYRVDVRDDPGLTRRPTDGVDTYRRVIAERGVPRGYRPVSRPAWGILAAPWQTTIGRFFAPGPTHGRGVS